MVQFKGNRSEVSGLLESFQLLHWAVLRARHGSLGSAYNEQKDTKENTHCKWVLAVTELFNIAVNDFGAKKSAHHSWVLAVTEVVVRGTQCILKF